MIIISKPLSFIFPFVLCATFSWVETQIHTLLEVFFYSSDRGDYICWFGRSFKGHVNILICANIWGKLIQAFGGLIVQWEKGQRGLPQGTVQRGSPGAQFRVTRKDRYTLLPRWAIIWGYKKPWALTTKLDQVYEVKRENEGKEVVQFTLIP